MINGTSFAIPHSSYIVNLNYVTSYQRNEISLTAPYQNVKISVATRKQTLFKNKFLDFINEDIDDDA